MEPREYIDADGHAHRTWEHGLARSYVEDEQDRLINAPTEHTAGFLRAINTYHDNVRFGIAAHDLGTIAECMFDAADGFVPSEILDQIRPLLAREMLKGVK